MLCRDFAIRDRMKQLLPLSHFCGIISSFLPLLIYGEQSHRAETEHEWDQWKITGVLDLGRTCSIRGARDAPKYNDFILPLIFTKRLCDVFEDESQPYRKGSAVLFCRWNPRILMIPCGE